MTIPTIGNVATNSGNNATTLDVTFTVTAGADRILLALADTADTAQADQVTGVVLDPGGLDEAAFTAVGDAYLQQATHDRVAGFVLVNPPTGTFTVRFTASAGMARFIAGVMQVNGVDQTTPTGATAAASGDSATPSVSVTTTAADSLVIGSWIHRAGLNLTPGTDVTEHWDIVQSGYTGWGGSKGAATVGSYTVDGTSGGADDWVALGVEVLAVAAAGHDPLVADAGSYTITGQAAGLLASRILGAEQGTYTLTGQDASLLRGFLLEAEVGSYTVTGQDAALLVSRLLSADQGAYTLTGQDAELLANRLLSADQGSYTLTGQEALLLATRLLAADTGNYSISGQDATLLASRILVAAAGSYTLTGQDATLTHNEAGALTLEAGAGSYTITGHDASFLVSRLLSADAGAYVLTGQDADILRRFVLEGEAGSYGVSGQDAALVVARVLLLDAGSYVLSGQDATLTFSGATIQVYTASAKANLSPVVLVVSNITPAVDAKANPSPVEEVEIG